MGLMANRAATRMQTRQMYRTASRMQRRRSGGQSAEGQQPDAAPAAAAAPEQPAYVSELEQLARLRDQGVISPAEFEAKKRQLLGI